MKQTLDDLYFEWLYAEVWHTDIEDESKTYWKLLKQLYVKEFIWIVPNDDNRITDGLDLREEFVIENDYDDVDPDWNELGCSVLEMMVALARRLNFEAERSVSIWFWQMIYNLGMDRFNDANFPPDMERGVDEALERLIWRNYSRHGVGGLFPLVHTNQDQTKVEIWYQLNEYLLERG